MTTKVEFVEADPNEWPKCPYCQKELRRIIFRKRGWLSSMWVFWCPHCKSLLGTSSTFNA